MCRENAGFLIVVSVPLTLETEVVIGYKQTSLGDQYVCWFCSNGIDYYWGKYCHTYKDALWYMQDRIGNYLEIR